MQQKQILGIIPIFVAALFVSPILISNVHAQGVTGKTVILRDNAFGHTKRWDPDGATNAFTISDADVSPGISTILVNTKQLNFVNCAVDYLYSGAFEVQCINIKPGTFGVGGPWNGGELHYTVFNKVFSPWPFGSLGSDIDPSLSEDVLTIIKNRTQGVEGAADLAPEQSLLDGLSRVNNTNDRG